MGRVDFPALEAFCNRLIDRGIAALVPCGTTGEAPLLTAEEHHQVVATDGRGGSRARAGDRRRRQQQHRQPPSSSHARRNAPAPRRCSASRRCYLKPSQAGMMVHFRTIHDAVGLPIILYDVPARTACALDDVTVRRLAELPRIVGLKDATGDIPRVARLRRRLGTEFLLLSGDDASQAAFRMAGGDGCISVTANVVPALCGGPASRLATRGWRPTSAGSTRSWRRCTRRCSSRPTRFR